MARAISSCSSGGNCRTVASAISKSFVMTEQYSTSVVHRKASRPIPAERRVNLAQASSRGSTGSKLTFAHAASLRANVGPELDRLGGRDRLVLPLILGQAIFGGILDAVEFAELLRARQRDLIGGVIIEPGNARITILLGGDRWRGGQLADERLPRGSVEDGHEAARGDRAVP